MYEESKFYLEVEVCFNGNHKAIAKAFAHLKCTVFDQLHVVAGLQGGGKLEVVGADMFETRKELRTKPRK